jgi:hypothetical protein
LLELSYEWKFLHQTFSTQQKVKARIFCTHFHHPHITPSHAGACKSFCMAISWVFIFFFFQLFSKKVC